MGLFPDVTIDRWACLKHEMEKWRTVTPVSLNSASLSLSSASVSLNITDLKVVSTQYIHTYNLYLYTIKYQS